MLKEKLTKKRVIITSISIIAVITFICIIIILTQAQGAKEKLTILNDKLAMQIYKITLKTDKLTSVITRYDSEACKEEKNNTTTFKQYTKDGNAYIVTNDKIYEYQNNDNILYEVIEPLAKLANYEYSTGTEKINGKSYEYQEYDNFDELLVSEFDDSKPTTQSPKTRLYFSGKNLKYIKTIKGENEELIEIQISFKVDKKEVQIPSDANIVKIGINGEEIKVKNEENNENTTAEEDDEIENEVVGEDTEEPTEEENTEESTEGESAETETENSDGE